MCSGDLWSHHVTFPANAAYAAQYKDTMVAYMIYYVNVLAKQTTVSLYIRLLAALAKNRPKHAFASWHIYWTALSFPSLPHPETSPPSLNMSGASVLAGAHHFVARDNMFITTNTVSRMVL